MTRWGFWRVRLVERLASGKEKRSAAERRAAEEEAFLREYEQRGDHGPEDPGERPAPEPVSEADRQEAASMFGEPESYETELSKGTKNALNGIWRRLKKSLPVPRAKAARAEVKKALG